MQYPLLRTKEPGLLNWRTSTRSPLGCHSRAPDDGGGGGDGRPMWVVQAAAGADGDGAAGLYASGGCCSPAPEQLRSLSTGPRNSTTRRNLSWWQWSLVHSHTVARSGTSWLASP